MSVIPGPAAEAAAEVVVARTVQLARVPAPPFGEESRALIVEAWWTHDGLADVQRDGIGNVWGQLRAGVGAALVVCAHLDTVFAAEVDHEPRWNGTTLVGPGVGDDTVAVASLSVLDRLLPADLRHPVWALGTVGEEGLGDLRGMRFALDHPPGELPRIGAAVALEGNYLGRVTTTGVGSARWQVSITAPGGHAWEDSEAPSAVHAAADLIKRITSLPRPPAARTSINVGTIAGGESVNSRAQTCTFRLDLRADEPGALEALQDAVDAILAEAEGPVAVALEPIGLRPAGSIDAAHPLVVAAVAALADVGLHAELVAASTDANAAYSRGIPAVTLGVTEGDGTHTETEWIRTEHIPVGLAALAQTIVTFDHEDW